jgi:glutathione S-transferase
MSLRPMKPNHAIRLYRTPISGHAHRAQLFLSLLSLPYELIDVDVRGGAHKKPEFLAINPMGQVPVMQDGEVILADSNAILVYLALRYGEERWLPRDPLGAAHVQRFLSLAAGELARGPSTARRTKILTGTADPDAQAVASRLFAVLEQHLVHRSFLVSEHATIADIAHYTYVAVAPEGEIELSPYPHLQTWLRRIQALPGFVPMSSLAPRTSTPPAS